jgi:hypothetical protein
MGTEGTWCAITACRQIEEQETEVANERIDLAGVFATSAKRTNMLCRCGEKGFFGFDEGT